MKRLFRRTQTGLDEKLGLHLIRGLLVVGLLILMPVAQGCHNDQKMIDKHEQALAAEED